MEVAMERHCHKGHENLDQQGGMGHWQEKMEMSMQDLYPAQGEVGERSANYICMKQNRGK